MDKKFDNTSLADRTKVGEFDAWDYQSYYETVGFQEIYERYREIASSSERLHAILEECFPSPRCPKPTPGKRPPLRPRNPAIPDDAFSTASKLVAVILDAPRDHPARETITNALIKHIDRLEWFEQLVQAAANFAQQQQFEATTSAARQAIDQELAEKLGVFHTDAPERKRFVLLHYYDELANGDYHGRYACPAHGDGNAYAEPNAPVKIPGHGEEIELAAPRIRSQATGSMAVGAPAGMADASPIAQPRRIESKKSPHLVPSPHHEGRKTKPENTFSFHFRGWVVAVSATQSSS
jgi:hypothetical protein